MNTRDGWVIIDEHFLAREYKTYERYVFMQGEKLDIRPGMTKRFSDGMRGAIALRVPDIPGLPSPPANVLCLGARVGGEVIGFIDCGYFAIGIDLNPGEKNEHVLHGDFHELVFADSSIGIVYTNSLDHVLDIRKMVSEVLRVLKPGGIFLTENKGGTSEPGFRPARSDSYDCMEWDSLADLQEYICSFGFEMIHNYRCKGFTPWGMLFKKNI